MMIIWLGISSREFEFIFRY